MEGTGACRNPGEKKMGNVKECRKRDGIPRKAESGRNRKNTQPSKKRAGTGIEGNRKQDFGPLCFPPQVCQS